MTSTIPTGLDATAGAADTALVDTDEFAIQVAVAQALAGALPDAALLSVAPHPSPQSVVGPFTVAYVSEFVGARSADLALVVTDPATLAEAAGLPAPSAAAARPALEAATAVLGAGLLGELTEADASALLGAPGTGVFELVTPTGTAGWLAIRLHSAAPAARPTPAPVANLARIRDVELTLTVEIGRTRMPVRELLSLEPGTVVELDRAAGAPADILLNGRLVAHGDVVVVDQDYAVRITRILDTPEAL